MSRTFDHIAPISDSEVKSAIQAAVEQVRRSLPTFTFAAQNHSSVNNIFPAVPNRQWTAGFWPGTVWLAFEASGDKTFRYAAQIQVQQLLFRIENHIETDHHDMGFLFIPSCVAAWKLIGNQDGRRAALMAADNLIARFQEKGAFLQAWGPMSDPENYRFIIDSLLNLPLLFWAGAETGDPKYRAVALRHAQTVLNHAIRADHSTYHTFFMDRATGAPLHGATNQGYADDSAWARGQAWAITGTALLCRYENRAEYHETFDNLLAYYLDRLPADMVPYWDLIFNSGDQPRDSSAAAITVCGLLEMAKYAAPGRAAELKDLARRMLASLVGEYAVGDPQDSNGLVLHGTYSQTSPYNTCVGEGVDECTSWGDYFYFEALTRLMRDWQPYW
jgi:unsaturated chondroitin disaccharide hydrolase